MGVADELEKLRALHAVGSLTDAEHAAAKARVLASDAAPTTQERVAAPIRPAHDAKRSPIRKAIFGVLGGFVLLFLFFVWMRTTAITGAKMQSFTLTQSAPVRVEVRGVSETDKGFDVDLINPAEWKNIKAGKGFQYYDALSSHRVGSFAKTANLAVGQYGLVVRNSYNLLMTMNVHVKITVNP